MFPHGPGCKCSRCKPSNEHWCATHQCPKTWMMTSSFCPKCEALQHGDKGRIPDPPVEDDEKTEPFIDIGLDLDDLLK